MGRRILFLYLTKHSGHYAAAVSVEEAIRRLDPAIETRLLDSFSHANPVLSKVTLRAYLTILKTAPEIWEYMYDNKEFKERTRRIRELLNKGNSRKLQRLLDEFKPDVVVCTQGFACGVMASWKRATHRDTPKLVGVLTDYVAHMYWADPNVDVYITPNEEIRNTLVSQGVQPDRVRVYGIPISNRFRLPVDKAAVRQSLDLDPGLPNLLLMGGSLGLGPMKSVIRKLDKLPPPFNMICVTGKNEELKERLEKQGQKLRHPTRIMGFAENIHELMEIADVAITKPGGITTAEALAKRLPMIIINPIPGQEQKNTEFLLRNGVAVKAEKTRDVAEYVANFLRDPSKLASMRAAATGLGRPYAADHAAVDVLALMGNPTLASASL